MTGNTESSRRRGNRWRIVGWGFAAALILLPVLAKLFTDEMAWNRADFVIAITLVVGVGVIFELAVRLTRNSAYRAAVGVALAATFILVWLNGAVGIIGSEDNPANLMYFGVLGVGILGAAIARLRPGGMARALIATALAQALVTVIAVVGKLGVPASGALELLGLNGFLLVLWLTSAWLFRNAAHDQASGPRLSPQGR